MGHDRFGAIEHAPEIDSHHIDPIGGLHVVNECVLGDTGVVDQDIQATQTVDRVENDLFGSLVVSDITSDGDGFSASLFDRPYEIGCLSAARTEVGGNARPFGSQCQGDSSAYSTRGARYESDLTLKIHDTFPHLPRCKRPSPVDGLSRVERVV